MSWKIFHTECMALTGMPHISTLQFAQRMAMAYHNCVLRHFESMTGGGVVISTTPFVPMLVAGFIYISAQNATQHSQVNWLSQIGKYIKNYWIFCFI